MGLLHDLIWGKPVNGSSAGGSGSSDFSTAEVTINVLGGDGLAKTLNLPNIISYTDSPIGTIFEVENVKIEESGIKQVLLSENGVAYFDIGSQNPDKTLVSYEGNIEAVTAYPGIYIISGDCTLNINLPQKA